MEFMENPAKNLSNAAIVKVTFQRQLQIFLNTPRSRRQNKPLPQKPNCSYAKYSTSFKITSVAKWVFYVLFRGGKKSQSPSCQSECSYQSALLSVDWLQ
jgi:hypothetical protein